MFTAEDLTGSSHTGENFVGEKQDIAFIAEFSQFGEEIIRRHDGSAPALDGFQNECGDLIGGGFSDEGVIVFQIFFGIQRAVFSCPHWVKVSVTVSL